MKRLLAGVAVLVVAMLFLLVWFGVRDRANGQPANERSHVDRGRGEKDAERGSDNNALSETLPVPVRMTASDRVGEIYFNEAEQQPTESEIAFEARVACVENIKATIADLAMTPEEERKFLLVLHWAHTRWDEYWAQYLDKRDEARELSEDPNAVPKGGVAVMRLLRRSLDKQLGTFLSAREVTRVGAAGLPNPISCRNALLTLD